MSTQQKKSRRRVVAIGLIGLGVAGIAAASASQLTVNPSRDVASGVSTEITGCDTSVDTTYDVSSTLNADGSFDVVSITVSDIAAACAGKDITVYALDSAGNQLGTGTDAVTAPATTVAVTGATNHTIAKIAVAIK